MVALRRARVRLGNKPMGGLSPLAVWGSTVRQSRRGPAARCFTSSRRRTPRSPAIEELTRQATTPEAIRNKAKPTGPAKVSVNELWPGYVGDVLGGVQGKVVAIADCLGDWREELIVSLPGELRIYSTTTPATTRRTCLMEDRQYRTSVARQTMGYFYPPIPREP